MALCRMWGALRALIWGENLASDPVGAALGLALHYFSRGQLSVDVAALSQVRARAHQLKNMPSTDRLHSSLMLLIRNGFLALMIF